MARKKKEVPEEVISPEVPETVAPSISEGPKRVKVTPEELQRLQDEKRLIGYDPVTCEATIS